MLGISYNNCIRKSQSVIFFFKNALELFFSLFLIARQPNGFINSLYLNTIFTITISPSDGGKDIFVLIGGRKFDPCSSPQSIWWQSGSHAFTITTQMFNTQCLKCLSRDSNNAYKIQPKLSCLDKAVMAWHTRDSHHL